MLFRKNEELERGVWVDRGVDGRVDGFQVCAPCNEAFLANDTYGPRWHDGTELCPDCRSGFEAHAMAVDLFGLPRPFNGMLEDRLITNDEMESDIRRPDPAAFDYFLSE
jgi:hypothetical protein